MTRTTNSRATYHGFELDKFKVTQVMSWRNRGNSYEEHPRQATGISFPGPAISCACGQSAFGLCIIIIESSSFRCRWCVLDLSCFDSKSHVWLLADCTRRARFRRASRIPGARRARLHTRQVALPLIHSLRITYRSDPNHLIKDSSK